MAQSQQQWQLSPWMPRLEDEGDDRVEDICYRTCHPQVLETGGDTIVKTDEYRFTQVTQTQGLVVNWW